MTYEKAAFLKCICQAQNEKLQFEIKELKKL